MEFATQRNYRTFLYVNTFLIVVLGAVAAVWGVFTLLPAELNGGFHNAMAAVQAIRKVLFWKVAVIYALTSVLIGLAIMVLHLFYSHRIAGPAYRVGLEAGRIGRGDLTGNITFRQKDNLTDMKDALNNVAGQYRDRVTAIRDNLAAVEKQTQTISDLIRQGDQEGELRKAADELSECVRKIERSLWEIRT